MSISAASFLKAIALLDQTWKNLDVPTEWERVSVVKKLAVGARPFLRIERRFNLIAKPTRNGHFDEQSSSEPTHQEDDPEALPPSTLPASTTPNGPLVTYEILHSPSYLVPVLYITLAPSTSSSSISVPSMEDLYNLLVPSPFESQLKNVGPTGALSQTEHPERGNVCWFVHPCLTEEAMEKVMVMAGREDQGQAGEEGREWIGREMEYLMKWFGVVGPSVGFKVPVEVALALDRRKA